MNKTHQFKLIDGIFSPGQAQQVLGAMVKSKIDFHTLEKHSEAERSGGAEELSQARLEYLRNLDGELKRLAETAKAAGKRLKISGDIEVTFLD